MIGFSFLTHYTHYVVYRTYQPKLVVTKIRSGNGSKWSGKKNEQKNPNYYYNMRSLVAIMQGILTILHLQTSKNILLTAQPMESVCNLNPCCEIIHLTFVKYIFNNNNNNARISWNFLTLFQWNDLWCHPFVFPNLFFEWSWLTIFLFFIKSHFLSSSFFLECTCQTRIACRRCVTQINSLKNTSSVIFFYHSLFSAFTLDFFFYLFIFFLFSIVFMSFSLSIFILNFSLNIALRLCPVLSFSFF